MNGWCMTTLTIASVVVFLVGMYFVLKWLKNKYPANTLLSKLPFKGGNLLDYMNWEFIRDDTELGKCAQRFHLWGSEDDKSANMAHLYEPLIYGDQLNDDDLMYCNKAPYNDLVNAICDAMKGTNMELGTYMNGVATSAATGRLVIKKTNTKTNTNTNTNTNVILPDIFAIRICFSNYDVIALGVANPKNTKRDGLILFNTPANADWRVGICEHNETTPINIAYEIGRIEKQK